jgi:hypothetical protein
MVKSQMDNSLFELLKKYGFQKGGFVFRLEIDTFFIEKEDGLYIKYTPRKRNVLEYKLKELPELYTGDALFNAENDETLDQYLPLLQSIELAIKTYYKDHPDLKDKNVIAILERLIQKPEIKPYTELMALIQNNLRLCLSCNAYSKKETIGGLKRILKSVKLHHQLDGSQGYLDFIASVLI